MFYLNQEITIKGASSSARGRLKGWSETSPGLMMLELPKINNLNYQMKPGAKFTMNFESKGAYFALTGKFASFLPKTDVWIFEVGNYDVENLGKARRACERFEFVTTVRVVNCETGETISNGIINDISRSGIGLSTEEPAAEMEGDMITVDFQLSGSFKFSKQMIELARIDSEGKKYLYGGTFYHLNEKAEKELKEFLELLRIWPKLRNAL